jgi:hypothetical protein
LHEHHAPRVLRRAWRRAGRACSRPAARPWTRCHGPLPGPAVAIDKPRLWGARIGRSRSEQ